VGAAELRSARTAAGGYGNPLRVPIDPVAGDVTHSAHERVS
jgi:hypothetical protein